ncbi:MAG: type I glutamate--ammonia ligase [Desulfurococcales archaeon]|nr:type I glutamate--ammonia ligase [Desulfurococcales archaeon]
MSVGKYSWYYVYFTDLFGTFRRVLLHSSLLDEKAFKEGLGKLDGSSVRGFTTISESDLVLKPDPKTILPYPWCGDLCEEGVGRVIADVYKPRGRERLPQDPRGAARRVEELLAERGLRALMAAELEYFIFDGIKVKLEPHIQYSEIIANKAPWSEAGGLKVAFKDGYYVPSPHDAGEEVKYRIIRTLTRKYGIKVEVSHHEVAGASQHELNFQPGSPVETADRIQLIKEAVKTEAALSGKVATFMPKPITGDNGSGVHVHVSIWSGDTNLFYDESDEYAGISGFARSFIAGILEHARPLSAIVSPTVNSYKRLVPGFEAPVYLVWSKANRSAAIRVPAYHRKASAARIEFRSPDPSMNPYLALSAVILAGLDGVDRKLDPGDPVDENVYLMTPEKRRQLGIKTLPRSLDEALDELESDHEWLLRAWPRELLEKYIEMKREETKKLAMWVSPAELDYYAGV